MSKNQPDPGFSGETTEAIPDPIMFIDKRLQGISIYSTQLAQKIKEQIQKRADRSHLHERHPKTTHCSAEACPCAVAMRTKSVFFIHSG